MLLLPLPVWREVGYIIVERPRSIPIVAFRLSFFFSMHHWVITFVGYNIIVIIIIHYVPGVPAMYTQIPDDGAYTRA